MGKAVMKKTLIAVYIIYMAAVAALGVMDYITPSRISKFAGDDLSRFEYLRMESKESVPVSAAAGAQYQKYDATLKLFGLIPVKEVQVEVYPPAELIPGGVPFGVKLFTKGVIVVGLSEVQTAEGVLSPAVSAGLKKGDIITSINDVSINTIGELSRMIEESGGNPVMVDFTRSGVPLSTELIPAKALDSDKYKGGLWIRDSTAGIGIVTFINPKNNAFGGLGHGINDIDTGELMPLLRANIADVQITDVVKGTNGKPGELKGTFLPAKIGELFANTNTGVYGTFTRLPQGLKTESLPIALKDEVKLGDVTILSTIAQGAPQMYTARIIKINDMNSDTKNFVIEITDKRLLDTTGGIVQGMSGSPIVQNGKIIGAVTHVLVNDSTKGYGIFIENMLKNMSDMLK